MRELPLFPLYHHFDSMAFIDFFDDHPLLAFVLVGVLLFSLISAGLSSVAKPGVEGLPWVGVDEGAPFALTRAAFASVTSGKDWLNVAYQKVWYRSKSDQELCPDTRSTHNKAKLISSQISVAAMRSSSQTTSCDG